jgi:prepilin-type N-terminal cleavage/methylation domain-containing protein
MCTFRKRRRRGFTLIELLVVIAIITLLSVIGYLVIPTLNNDYNRVRAVDQISEYLLTAKMRAKRDGLPTGIRFNATSGQVNQIYFVQQPDAITGATMGATLTGIAANAMQPPVAASFTGGDWVGAGNAAGDQYAPVQAGDYLEINGGGPVYVIGTSKAGAAAITLTANGATVSLLNASASFSGSTSNWRIIRMPRLMEGEDVKQLPGDLVVDLGQSLRVPTRTLGSGTIGTAAVSEIVFSPSVSVVNPISGSGKIILWIADPGNASQPQGPSTLIAINTRSGFIGAYDVNLNGGDPYSFTEDGRGGGF